MKDELNLWRFDGNICDHGICIGDCDKCSRNLPFQEERTCENCESSEMYGNYGLVCWLYSDNDCHIMSVCSDGSCPDFTPKGGRG